MPAASRKNVGYSRQTDDAAFAFEPAGTALAQQSVSIIARGVCPKRQP